MGSRDVEQYHLRVALSARLVADNVLYFEWCGWVYDVRQGTYDLSILFRNIAVAGALLRSRINGYDHGVHLSSGRMGIDKPPWYPNLEGVPIT